MSAGVPCEAFFGAEEKTQLCLQLANKRDHANMRNRLFPTGNHFPQFRMLQASVEAELCANATRSLVWQLWGRPYIFSLST